VAKVVTFGAFVEILPGVEGLVHISELAAHHVENPREVVAQGQAVNVRILEIDGERRRLSLSLKRVEEGEQPVPRADGAESVHTMPNLILSEEAFPTGGASVELVDDAVGDERAMGDADAEAGAELLEAAVEPDAEVMAEAEIELTPEAEIEVELPEAAAEPEAEPEDDEVETSEEPALEVVSDLVDSD
jgi:small subunit ribosomal protein S1